MISEVRVVFNKYILDKLSIWPDVCKVVYDHPSKQVILEKTCEELVKAQGLDLSYNRRYDQMIESMANIYIRRLLSTLEYEAKSAAEKTRLERVDDKEKRMDRAVSDDGVIDLNKYLD